MCHEATTHGSRGTRRFCAPDGRSGGLASEPHHDCAAANTASV
jgi:hypothetical protein